MPDRLQQLRRELSLDTVDPSAVRRRVDAALDADPRERRLYMKQKLRFAAILAAAVLALTGTALAASGHADLLRTFFTGDTSHAEPYVNHTVYSVSDQNYTFSVESSIADERNMYLLVRVDALNPSACTALMREDFDGMDTFLVSLNSGKDRNKDNSTPATASFSVGYSELRELRTESSRAWRLSTTFSSAGAPIESVNLRLGFMDRSKTFTVPVTPVESRTLTIGDSGMGKPSFDVPAGMVQLDSVTISPLSMQMTLHCPQGSEATMPLLLLRMKDGTWQSQSTVFNSSTVSAQRSDETETDYVWTWDCQLRSVQDLDQVESIVVFDRAYPLDGSAPYPVEVPDTLKPFTVTMTQDFTETTPLYLPLRDLCEPLGYHCTWDSAAHAAICTDGDTRITITQGSAAAQINDSETALEAPALIAKGRLSISIDDAETLFGIDMERAFDRQAGQFTDTFYVTP